MLNFKPISLEDISLIRPFFQKQNTRMCDCTIGGTFMWREYFHAQFSIVEDTLFFKVKRTEGETAFPFPIGGDAGKAVQLIADHCKRNQLPLIFCKVSKNDLPLLKEKFPVSEIKGMRDWFDYLYSSADLTGLTGKKYSGQRNHISRFKRLYPDHGFEEISGNNLDDVKKFFHDFCGKYPKKTGTANEENSKVLEVLENYGPYGLAGGVIKVAGKIAAMSIGEIVNDTLFVHIEKANIAYHGAYQMIVNMFAKHFVSPQIKFINREEDTGDEGLRVSKLSYHPVELIEKYTVRVKEES